MKKPYLEAKGHTTDKKAGFDFKFQGDHKQFQKISKILTEFIEEEEKESI